MIRWMLIFGLIGSAAAATGSNPSMADAAFIPTALLCLILLVCSAFFSSAETAIFGLQLVDIEAMSGKSERNVRTLLDDPRQTLASILIGNETVNIALSTASAGLLLQLFPNRPWLTVVVVTPLLLIFGEVLPKTFAFRFARQLAPRSAQLLHPFARLVAPIRFILGRLADAALVITGGSRAPRQAELRQAHLRAMIDRGREEGNIRAMEQEILHRVFEFGDLSVSELMTPRPDIFSLNLLTPWDELIEKLRESGMSRVPIWQGSPNNIVGILLVKRLLGLVAAQRISGRHRSPSPRQIHKLLHPPRFIPASKAADELLAEFQARRSHMALVVDEHGTVVGIVTLDDLLEELVGEMFDETDAEDPAVTAIEADTWVIRGDMTIEDFAERFHLVIPAGNYATLSDLVTSLSTKTPLPGEEIEWNGIRFKIEAMDDQKIDELQVTLEQAYEEDDPTAEADFETEETP